MAILINMKETLTKVADTTLQEPVSLSVDIKPRNRVDRLLQQWGILPKKRVFLITPICLGTLLHISKILLSIDVQIHQDQQKLLETIYQAISSHGEKMAQIVALSIQNSNSPVDPALVDFILRNFTAREMMSVLTIVVKQMDVSSFLSSIISIRGLNVLETPPVLASPANEAGVSL